jgi:hypothetical protein
MSRDEDADDFAPDGFDLEPAEDTARDADAPLPVRFHMLKAAGRSGMHARMALAGKGDPTTTAMEKGSATHAILFATAPVVFFPGKARRGKEWETWKALRRRDELIVSRSEYEAANKMADAVRSHSLAMDVLNGTHERTILWDSMGRTCRTTPDAASYLEFATELKTCACSDPQRFVWQAIRMHYHAQMAWHLGGITNAGLGQPANAYVVAVESAPPWPVTVLRLTDRALDKGQALCQLWFEKLLGFERSNQWPAYAGHVVDLDVPDDDDLNLTFGDVEAA